MADKYLDLAKKLKMLAEKGEGGEAVNAQKQLDKLMKKYNITIESLESELIEAQMIFASNRKLIHQLVVKIFGANVDLFKRRGERKKHIIIKCTKAQGLELQMMYDHYIRLYKSEMEIFYLAFLKANNLLVKGDKDYEPTDAEIQEQKRANAMILSIKSDTYRKSINQSN